jgi:phasin family protein
MASQKPSGTPDLEDLFKPFANMVPDWSKAMAGFGQSGRIWQDMIQSHQRNIESVSRLNDGVADAMRQIAERQLELMRTTMSELQRISEAMRKPGGAGVAMSPDAMSAAFERSLGAMREIAQIAERANRDALEAITQRSQAFQQELQQMMQPPANPT